MLVRRTWMIVLLLYLSGIILYSSLFILSANQFALFQYIKTLVAALHCLVFIIPTVMAQSQRWLFRIIGYVVLIAYFTYVFFLIGYFSYFGFVPEIYALGLENAGDLIEVSNHYFAQIFGLREVALIVCALAFFFLLQRDQIPTGSLLILILPLGLFGASVVNFGAPVQTAAYGNESVIRRFGLPTFYYLSLQERLNFTSEYLAEETPFPGKLSQIVYPDQAGSSQLATDPLEAVQKVILVQIESFDPQAIDATLNDKAVMPFVSNIRNTACLEFTNFHTIKSVGGSSDAEFSVATGRLPSTRRQSIRYADFTKMDTLYGILADNGIKSYFAHNNNIGFYGRNFAYSQLSDVETFFLRPDEVISEREFALGWLSTALATSDHLFYYFFNFQSHGPFQGYSTQAAERFDLSIQSDIKSDYMATMYDVDQTISAMFALQQTYFDQGDSLFILTADHPSALHLDGYTLNNSRIPLLLCHKTFDGTQVENLGSTVNLFSTILDAFDIPSQNIAIADSLLSDGPGVVLFPTQRTLYRKPDGELALSPCTDAACRKFFDYTDQSIRISN